MTTKKIPPKGKEKIIMQRMKESLATLVADPIKEVRLYRCWVVNAERTITYATDQHNMLLALRPEISLGRYKLGERVQFNAGESVFSALFLVPGQAHTSEYHSRGQRLIEHEFTSANSP